LTNLIVHFVYKQLLLLRLLNSLLHETQSVCDDFPVQLKFILLSLNPLVLLLDFNWEKVHHLVVLVDLLVLLGLDMLMVPHFVKSRLKLIEFLSVVLLVLLSVFLELVRYLD